VQANPIDKRERYLCLIARAYPDLRIASAELNEVGQNSDVLVVNGELIFRFPRYAHGIASLKAEAAVLARIAAHVPLPVPSPSYIHLEGAAVGEAFVGHRRIPGEPLWREIVEAIQDVGVVDALAAQLAGFLRALHAIPVEQVFPHALPVSDTYEENADLYARFREKLYPYMRPDARAWASRHFETFLDDPRSSSYTPVLKHGDCGPSNILYDPETQRITGFIDLGSCLGDPAYDFAGLLSGYGESFLRRCCGVYPEILSTWERILFYQGTFALVEALFGVENGDEDAFRAGIEPYI